MRTEGDETDIIDNNPNQAILFLIFEIRSVAMSLKEQQID